MLDNIRIQRLILNHWIILTLFALQFLAHILTTLNLLEIKWYGGSYKDIYMVLLSMAYFLDYYLYKNNVYKTSVPPMIIIGLNIVVILL